jgi:hypothetical protein
MAIDDFLAKVRTPESNTPPPETARYSGADVVSSNLEKFMSPGSDYIQNARQRGIEYAATRGGVNSSIAAGASERSALEAAGGLAQQATGIDAQREQTRDSAILNNWIDQQGFNRQFQGELAMMPVQNSLNMLNNIQRYALEDPALYTPDVVSGYTNFFQKNMQDFMSRYFGGT